MILHVLSRERANPCQTTFVTFLFTRMTIMLKNMYTLFIYFSCSALASKIRDGQDDDNNGGWDYFTRLFKWRYQPHNFFRLITSSDIVSIIDALIQREFYGHQKKMKWMGKRTMYGSIVQFCFVSNLYCKIEYHALNLWRSRN